MIQDVYDGTSDVIVISQIRSRRYTSLLLTQSCLLSKHVLCTYTFTNVSKHVFQIRMCLLRTQRHGCQVYRLRVQLGLDLGSAWSVQRYLNILCTMSDYQGATSSNIKATRYTAILKIDDDVYVCICTIYSYILKQFTQHAFVYDSHFSTKEKIECCGAIIDNRSYSPICVLE